MLRNMLLAKIHRARVTSANLNYEGSITIDEDLMDEVGMLSHEKVQVLNITTGARAETYTIPGPRGKGDITMNGAIARLACVDDIIIILAYGYIEEESAKKIKPKIIILDEKNQIKKKLNTS